VTLRFTSRGRRTLRRARTAKLTVTVRAGALSRRLAVTLRR